MNIQIQLNNPCIRCGQERITIKTWTEQTGHSIITHTTTACPDKNCQKIVDKQLALQKEKRAEINTKKVFYRRG